MHADCILVCNLVNFLYSGINNPSFLHCCKASSISWLELVYVEKERVLPAEKQTVSMN